MNPALLITVAIQLGCQAFKVVYYSIRNRRLEAHRLFSTGGMPSAHSAFVSALTVSVGLVEGWASAAFTVSVVLAAIVVFDAIRLRRTVDHHSRVLHELIALLPDKRPAFDPPVVGHSTSEVVVGIVVGTVFATLAYQLFVA
ncbi:MAG: divergent PAP2 family protein [Spirochaetaceae bacterium]|nr:divergent PAP2 family protein [Spirochaetaceae bacterium]